MLRAEGHRRCIDQLLLRAFVISDERADVICSSARPVGGLGKQGSGEAPSIIGWMAGSGGGEKLRTKHAEPGVETRPRPRPYWT